MTIFFHNLLILSLFGWGFLSDADWGFYGHRQINYYALFTLPQEMLSLYKSHITFISDHAVDADKRRYATPEEGPRHYIDLDKYGEPPFEGVPRSWTQAKLHFLEIEVHFENEVLSVQGIKLESTWKPLFNYLAQTIANHFYEVNWEISGIDSLWNKPYKKIVLSDNQFEHGILPFQVPLLYRQLVNAMIDGEVYKILHYSADLGHYVADAHVPLHTTSNYNGQLTNQIGIHAFWESRIPELFAAKEYDLLVGKAQYIDNIRDFIWQTVLESHQSVDSVLSVEKRLSQTFPKDRQYCFTERLESTVRIECEAYAAAYQEALNGMVEQRFQSSILAVGSLWYSAWVDAGQPDFTKHSQVTISEKDKKELERLESLYQGGQSKGRDHN